MGLVKTWKTPANPSRIRRTSEHPLLNCPLKKRRRISGADFSNRSVGKFPMEDFAIDAKL
jgi:hypothetical protein